MDSFNPDFNPFNSKTIEESEKAAKKTKEEEGKRREAEKLAEKAVEEAKKNKEKDPKTNGEKKESFFSIKSRAEKAAEKAQGELPDGEKSNPRKLAEKVSEDEDNFSQEERALIKLNEHKIANRTEELLHKSDSGAAEEGSSLGERIVKTLTNEEALGLAVAEVLFDKEDEGIKANSQVIGDEEPTRVADILLSGVIGSSAPFVEKKIESNGGTSTGTNGPEGLVESSAEPEAGSDTESIDSSDGELTEMEEPGSNGVITELIENSPADDIEARKGTNSRPKDKLGARLLGFVGINNKNKKTIAKKAKPSTSIGGNYGAGLVGSFSGGSLNSASSLKGIAKTEVDRDGVSQHILEGAISASLAKKIVERVGKSRINSEKQVPEDLVVAQEYIRHAAPKSDHFKMYVEEEVSTYGQRDTVKIVDKPEELPRTYIDSLDQGVVIKKEAKSAQTSYSRHDVYSYQMSESSDSHDLDLTAKGFSEIEIDREPDSIVLPTYEPYSTEPRANTAPNLVNNEISKINIKQFERYLDGLILKYRPKSSKDLQRKVKKDYGRALTLAEIKNIDHYWTKKQAEIFGKTPEIFGGLDKRIAEFEEGLIDTAGSSKTLETTKPISNKNISFKPEDISNITSDSNNGKVPIIKKNNSIVELPTQQKRNVINIIGMIFLILVLIYVIGYAIILMN